MPVGLPSVGIGAAATVEVSAATIVVLGRIVGPHGLRGALRVFPFADDPAAWSRLPQWWLGEEGQAAGEWRPTRLISCQLSKDVLLAQLEGVADRTAAEAMAGVLVGVPHAVLPATAPDEYYWADLVGLEVVNTHDQVLGTVTDLIETPANTVLCVSDGHRAERLLPFVAAVVVAVELERRRVRVDWGVDW